MATQQFEFLDFNGPIAMAHQGGGREFPGNTMLAFEGAVSLGYRYVETDVHLSADGVVVVCHDATLDATTDAHGAIADLSWDQLRRANVHGGGHLARLDEILASWPDLRINIDPKSDDVVEPLSRLLLDHQAVGRVCVGSFSDKRVSRTRELCGRDLCTAMGPKSVGKLLLASRGVLRNFRCSEQLAQIPVTQNHLPVFSDKLCSTAHSLGIGVHIWTIDDPQEMHRLLDASVDGIITDAPTALRDVLIARRQWHQDPGI